ncbi:sugar ABC transporter ATP-binding protein [Cellulomonas fimi]|uniref:ABC transporter related protein n=2 Tax=Cellulomonas fimi TaxID=1708 RepID=F4GYI9_CELFA|nr:ABC transporter related protein [Cellulomonas fimi ATCC 484]NNH07323.1 sugar ABC transporter ATP-binding protein [Cellulomonas fimi]VEH35267.1 Arabinose import ATP-binding protein AraG [Cellulomonas fimi]
MTSENVLTVTDMSKTFGVVRALKGVDFQLRDGEVHGLIGENGSGKSTLTSIIAGQQNADRGQMAFQGAPWAPGSTNEALEAGVGMIVQESGTVPGITVAENMFLGASRRFSRFGLVDRKAMGLGAAEALAAAGIEGIEPSAVAGSLDFQARKLVELARVMMHRPKVVVIDETTTALSQDGRQTLYRLVTEQKARGAVVFISHDLEEIMTVCDRLTVLRDGELIRTFDKNEFDEDAIRAAMIGRNLEGQYYREDTAPSARPEVVLAAERVTVGAKVVDVSLEVRSGEIVGIGGLSHSGMHELGKALFGAVRLDAGTVTARGRRITSEPQAVRAAMGYVSKDRDTESLSLTASIRDNIASAGLRLIGRGRAGLITSRAERRYVQRPMEQLAVKATSSAQVVGTLSGGNKQKVVFGKWIACGSEILILDCPTRGVDVGVKQAMYQLMADLKNEGKAIVMVSEEMTELMGMCDRVLIMKEGRVTREFERSPELTEMEIIQCMI